MLAPQIGLIYFSDNVPYIRYLLIIKDMNEMTVSKLLHFLLSSYMKLPLLLTMVKPENIPLFFVCSK
jgi:hypothetical protein